MSAWPVKAKSVNERKEKRRALVARGGEPAGSSSVR